MKRYQPIAFVQGSHFAEFEEELDLGGNEAAVDYLRQWEPDSEEGYSLGLEHSPRGSNDCVYETPDGRYELTYSLRMGYAGLSRIVNAP